MNNAEILDKEGAVVNGPASFYAIAGFSGMFFFSEDVDEKPDVYVLRADKTAIMVPAAGPGGQLGFQIIQAKGRPEINAAETIWAPKSGTTRFNSTNPLMYQNCRKLANAVRLSLLKP